MQMIQESSADKRQSLYLYTDEGSYEPLARIDRNGNQEQHIYYFHTDLNGLPEELTDEAGEIVWECSYQLWGKPIQEIAHREIQLKETFDKAPKTPEVHDVKVSQPSKVYYPDGTTKTTDTVRVVIRDKPIMAYPYVPED